MHDLVKVLEKSDSYRDFEGFHSQEQIDEATAKVKGLVATFDYVDAKVFGDVLMNLMMESFSEVGDEETRNTDWDSIAWALNEVLTTRQWSETEIDWKEV